MSENDDSGEDDGTQHPATGLLVSSVIGALDQLRRTLEGLHTPSADQSADASTMKMNREYDLSTCRAIATLCEKIIELFSREPDNYITANGVSAKASISQFINPENLGELKLYFDDFQKRVLDAQSSAPPSRHLTDFLSAWLGQINGDLQLAAQAKGLTTSQRNALWRWAGDTQAAQTAFSVDLQTGANAEFVRLAAEESARNLEAQRRATGQSGALSLGEEFNRIATVEQKAERNWTIVFLVALLVLVLVGGLIIFDFKQSWSETLIHLAIVLPIVGAASYATRIAKHHRTLARWAKTAAVQVDSVQAFAGQLSTTENKDLLILELGRNVFGPPQFGDAANSELYSPIPPDVWDAVKEIAAKLSPKV